VTGLAADGESGPSATLGSACQFKGARTASEESRVFYGGDACAAGAGCVRRRSL